jgi:hypothetical protein
MSHTINYCLSLAGKEFFSLLAREKVLLGENFEYFVENDLNLEVDLFGIDSVVEISGTTTVIWTSWKYTKFLNDEDTKSQVLAWESDLKSKFRDQSILRVDEILLENFSQETSDLWFADKNSFSNLLLWLNVQDELHWCKVN